VVEPEPLLVQNWEVVSAQRSWEEECAFSVLRCHLLIVALVRSEEAQERAVVAGRDLEGISGVATAQDGA
jgi:hypothetical protein